MRSDETKSFEMTCFFGSDASLRGSDHVDGVSVEFLLWEARRMRHGEVGTNGSIRVTVSNFYISPYDVPQLVGLHSHAGGLFSGGI